MRLLAFLLMIPFAAAAQPSMKPLGPSILDTGSAIMATDSFTLPGPEDGAAYEIGILSPRGRAPKGGFPVLFALDGQAVMELLTDDFLGGISGLPVIVTIGYDTDRRFAGTERTRDYTPPSADGSPVADPRGRPGGGASDFLDLITTQILPELKARTDIDMSRSTIWGHSYGGLFTLWASGQEAAPFARYVTASPSLWWEYGRFFDDVKAGAESWPHRTVDIHHGALERERASAPDNPNAQKLVKMRAALPEGALDDLNRRLRAAGVEGHYETFPGLSHGETFRHSIKFLLTQEETATDGG